MRLCGKCNHRISGAHAKVVASRLTRVSESAHQAGETPAAHWKHAVDGRLHRDLPVASVALEADLANAKQIDRPRVMDAMEVTPLERRHDLAERADVAKGLAAASSDDRFVSRRFQVIDGVRFDHQASGAFHVQQYAFERCGRACQSVPSRNDGTGGYPTVQAGIWGNRWVDLLAGHADLVNAIWRRGPSTSTTRPQRRSLLTHCLIALVASRSISSR